MVRDIEAGLLDTVVFFRLDRLSRSPRLTHSLLEDVFKKHDAGVTSITEGFDASSKEGRMLVGILASVAAYYLDSLAENITEGLRTRKAKGEYSTTPPYGWRWKESVGPDGERVRGDAIEVVPEEARWVKQMAEWVLAGWGTPKVARELNRLGVRTRRGAHVVPVPGQRSGGRKGVPRLHGLDAEGRRVGHRPNTRLRVEPEDDGADPEGCKQSDRG